MGKTLLRLGQKLCAPHARHVFVGDEHIDRFAGKAVQRTVRRGREPHLKIFVLEGALYPALHRLEKRGWLASDWQRTDKGRRARYYRLTDDGTAELERRRARWEGSAWAVRQILDAELES